MTEQSTTENTENTEIKQKKIRVKIKRQLNPEKSAFWEEYELPWKPGLNIISLLMSQNASPVTLEGKTSTPVTYESSCLEEVCGSCSMIVNGRVRQACSTLVDNLLEDSDSTITIEPMSKFPLIRDLIVDRERMFESLKWVQAWVPVDNYAPVGAGPAVKQSEQEVAYNWSRCMTCGCCLESCPQWSADEAFIGPQAIAQAMLFNMNPSSEDLVEERVDTLVQNGLNTCGNAGNCSAVCPKQVDLVGAISKANWQASKRVVTKLLGKH